MYYTDIKHYLELNEHKDNVTGVSVIAAGIVMVVMICLILMCA